MAQVDERKRQLQRGGYDLKQLGAVFLEGGFPGALLRRIAMIGLNAMTARTIAVLAPTTVSNAARSRRSKE